MAARSTMIAAMSTASNAVKTGLFTLFVPFVVAVWIPQRMIASGHAGMAVPLLRQVVGGLPFRARSDRLFLVCGAFRPRQGTPAPIFPTKSTVVRGPYRVNRNPMYSSVLAVVFGQALFYQSWAVAEYGAFSRSASTCLSCSTKNATLRTQFDGEYEEFCRRVPRWIPTADHLHLAAERRSPVRIVPACLLSWLQPRHDALNYCATPDSPSRVEPADIPEQPLPHEPPLQYAQRLARDKARAVFAQAL